MIGHFIIFYQCNLDLSSIDRSSMLTNFKIFKWQNWNTSCEHPADASAVPFFIFGPFQKTRFKLFNCCDVIMFSRSKLDQNISKYIDSAYFLGNSFKKVRSMDISHQHSTSFNCLSLQLSDIQSVANIFGSKCKGSVDGKLPKKAHPIHTTRSPELVELPWPATFFERKRVYWNNKNWKQTNLKLQNNLEYENASLILLDYF